MSFSSPPLFSSPLFFSPPRRVHIPSETLEHLDGSYKVEPGDGQIRDSYLTEHGVVTYLVINPKVRPDKEPPKYTPPALISLNIIYTI